MFFSGGKDAIAAGHLLRKHHTSKIIWLFLYFVDGLEIIERTLRHYEKKWSIKIERRPCHETLSLDAQIDGRKKQAYTYGDTEKIYRKEFSAEWICDGQKKADSLARRGALSHCKDGIDHQYKRIHPVIDWSDKRVEAYCKVNKLPVPVSYSMGLKRSFWIPDANRLLWLKLNFPKDYAKIIRKYPQCGDSIFKKLGEV